MNENTPQQSGGRRAKWPNHIAPARTDELYEQILRVMIVDKKYRDRDFSAAQLARMLGANKRHLALVFSKRFHSNYSVVVNRLRVSDAMNMLADRRYANVNVADVGCMAGFSNRQSFYTAFGKYAGMTPYEYRQAHLDE